MSARLLPNIEARAGRPAASLVDWARSINALAVPAGPVRRGAAGKPANGARPGSAPGFTRKLLLLAGDGASDSARRAASTGSFGCRMVPEVAEQLASSGIDPDYLGEFAALSGLEARDVLDFAGIDRTTVGRRKASGLPLPQDVTVKALQATDLMAQATEVFGAPGLAAAWLTKAHPSLDFETPLHRARTPWGMSKVQSILVALRYGAAA